MSIVVRPAGKTYAWFVQSRDPTEINQKIQNFRVLGKKTDAIQTKIFILDIYPSVSHVVL